MFVILHFQHSKYVILCNLFPLYVRMYNINVRIEYTDKGTRCPGFSRGLNGTAFENIEPPQSCGNRDCVSINDNYQGGRFIVGGFFFFDITTTTLRMYTCDSYVRRERNARVHGAWTRSSNRNITLSCVAAEYFSAGTMTTTNRNP
jgi:hypothetical protein